MPALDFSTIGIIVKLASNLLQRGFLEFKDAAQQFRELYGGRCEGAERYFEVVWQTLRDSKENRTPIREALKKADEARSARRAPDGGGRGQGLY